MRESHMIQVFFSHNAPLDAPPPSSCCSFDDYKLTTEWLLDQTSHRPKVAVICGSGLGLLADGATNKQTFRYQDIPNFPVSTGEPHERPLY